jgi:hypothetical protein
VLSVGLLSGLLTAEAAAATSLPPRQALLQAQRRTHELGKHASTSSVHSVAADALRELRGATARALWISPDESDAPAYGARIFTHSVNAVKDLQRLPRSKGAIRLILGADRGLAEGVITQARTGKAAHSLGAGGREAASGRLVAAARSYAKAWAQAFVTLTRLVTMKVTHVPAADLSAAAEEALGSPQIGLAGPMFVQNQPPLTRGGKPELFFAGSEGCPFCGIERWGMIVALSQFGKFSKLHLIQSDTTDPLADQTFTFFESSYKSRYIAFVPVEVWSNVRHKFKFKPLQSLSAGEQALLKRFDPPAQTPFIDVANRFIKVDSTTQPPLIAGMSWTQIADSLSDPSSASAQAIAGTAEVLTAEVCQVTGGNPQSVCSTPVVHQYEAALPLLNGQGGGCPGGTAGPAITRRKGAEPATVRSARSRTPRAQAARCHT